MNWLSIDPKKVLINQDHNYNWSWLSWRWKRRVLDVYYSNNNQMDGGIMDYML